MAHHTHDPIEIIKQDHAEVENLFAEYEELGDGAVATKEKLADEIVRALTHHAEMEEELCYAHFKDALTNEDDHLVEEALVEHAGIKQHISDLKTLDSSTPEFDAHMKVLIEQVRHHVKEEEKELLPKVKKEISEDELGAMGEAMMEFKASRASDGAA